MQEVLFASANLTLRGELYLSDQTNSPGILVCHGMHAEGFRWLPLYRSFARTAADRGLSCLLFDFRGCGKSDGQFDYGMGEQADARASLDFLLKQPGIDSSNAFILGRSLGGTIALYSFMDDPRVKGFALWATPPDHKRNIVNFIVRTRGRLGYWSFVLLSAIDRFVDATRVLRMDVWGLKMRPKEVRGKLMTLSGARLVSRKECAPIFLVAGSDDGFVNALETKDYEASIPGRKQLIVLEGTGHTFKGAEEEAISGTIDWFVRLKNS